MEVIHSFFGLRWSQQPKFHPLPAHILREFVKTPNGQLELLASKSRCRDKASKPPIFFVHGGEGHASVWLDWMTHLSTCYNGNTYAYSLRCHGASHVVPYFQMTWKTSLDDLASDLAACVWQVVHWEDQEPIVVAHSSGGGLAQFSLSNGLFKARALMLVGAVPHWGNMDVYWNWFRRIDPWFSIRMIFHLYHPNSPLSSPKLVHNAFFGPEYPLSKVPEFMRWMSNYEAMWWPFGMAGQGWSLTYRTWLEPVKILKNITHWDRTSDKVAVMIGTQDKMMRGTEGRMVKEYREGMTQIYTNLGVDAEGALTHSSLIRGPIREHQSLGVRLIEVENAGHHTQNDVQWEEAAEAVRRFADQV
jgi:pimeloyl-ACP methyl ester carboxylesterase